MRQRLLFFIFTFVCLATIASEPLNYLVVWSNSGAKRAYKLADYPRVEFKGSLLQIKGFGVEDSFPTDDIIGFTYDNMLLGDANGDGKVNVADISATISYIREGRMQDFSFLNADINGNKEIDDDDIVGIVDIIYNRGRFYIPGTPKVVNDISYIYRNDGDFNAFFRDEIEFISYSNFDKDNVYHDDIVVQTVHTKDSVYRIPLAAIDSIGFVKPQTIYREGSIPLIGELYDNLKNVEGSILFFDSSMPQKLTPNVGDKLVATDISSKLPSGFVGQVKEIKTHDDCIEVICDNIELQEAVSKFYGVYNIVVDDNTIAKTRGNNDGSNKTTYNYELPCGPIHIPSIDLSAFANEKDIFKYAYKNSFDITFTPKINIKVTRVIDDFLMLSHTNILTETDVDFETIFDLSCEKSVDEDKMKWTKSFLPKQDFIIPPCIPLYFDIGSKLSLSGEIAAGFTINGHVRQLSDILIYDASLYSTIGTILSPIVNRVDGKVDINDVKITWDYFGARAELKAGIYIRIGIPAITHVAGWVGGEFDGGTKINGELMFDIKRLVEGNPETTLYDELKDIAKIDITPYIGAHFMAAAVDDNYSFRLGEDFDTPAGTIYQGRIIPGFNKTEAKYLSDSKLQIKANITNDCIIPYTVGFALYDKDGNHIKTELYKEKYWTRHAFPSYSCMFEGIDKNKSYKAFPVIRFFDKYDMLASPSVDIDRNFPVKINSFEVTNKVYEKSAFIHNNKFYSICYNTAVNMSIENSEDVEDWGYVYEDLDGDTAHISFKAYGSPYTDNNYAYYRNNLKSHATLYEYVKYYDDDLFYHGVKKDYDLIYDLQPEAITLETISVEALSAILKCMYKGSSMLDCDCGLEYWTGSEKHRELIYGQSLEGEVLIPLYTVNPNTTYFYRAFIKIGEEYYRATETKTFVTKDLQLCPDDNHPHMIDMGLPSGTKWACCNVGASSPTEMGETFAWGETSPRTYFSLYNYQYYHGPIAKPGEFFAADDPEYLNGWTYLGNNICGSRFDAATVNWKDNWQMPSKEDIVELMSHRHYLMNDLITINGQEGILICGNGNYILWPIEKRRPGTPYYDFAPENSSYALYYLGEILKKEDDVVDSPDLRTVAYALELWRGLYGIGNGGVGSEYDYGGPMLWHIRRDAGAYIRPVSKSLVK